MSYLSEAKCKQRAKYRMERREQGDRSLANAKGLRTERWRREGRRRESRAAGRQKNEGVSGTGPSNLGVRQPGLTEGLSGNSQAIAAILLISPP